MVARLLGRDGRKLTAGSALLGPDGEVLAAARGPLDHRHARRWRIRSSTRRRGVALTPMETRPDGGVIPAEAQAVLDQFTAHGTPSQVRDQLAGWTARSTWP